MSCCPAGSWGQLIEKSADEYTPQGKLETPCKNQCKNCCKTGLDIYVVGIEKMKNGRCIIWNYDIFGLNGGRTRKLCDMFADHGFLVVMPDFYRDGKFHDPSQPGTEEFLKDQSDWSKLNVDFEEVVLPFAKEKGATSFGAIGTCWGSYMVVRECANPELKAGVSMHPSHSQVANLMGEMEKGLLQDIKCNQLFMPAGNDSPNVKAGGIGSEVLGDKLEILEFPDMLHGWTTRGDMSDASVDRDVKKAVQAAIDFFLKHL